MKSDRFSDEENCRNITKFHYRLLIMELYCCSPIIIIQNSINSGTSYSSIEIHWKFVKFFDERFINHRKFKPEHVAPSAPRTGFAVQNIGIFLEFTVIITLARSELMRPCITACIHQKYSFSMYFPKCKLLLVDIIFSFLLCATLSQNRISLP